MIANNSKEADCRTRKDGKANDCEVSKGSSPISCSPGLRLKDPRIVRVSRAFGGKDRHSKVCTIRGLRDRRVRLSVPTAIQLYDLQERLGLNQPSKVVDWLLNAAKREIDELPPLPIPPHQMVLSTIQDAAATCQTQSNKQGENSNAFCRAKSKSKQVARETTNEKDNWTRRNEEEKQERSEGQPGAQISSDNILNTAVPYGSFYHFAPSNFPLSHLGSHRFVSHTEEVQNFNIPLPSTLSLSSTSQLLVCPQGTTQPFFPFQPHSTSCLDVDPRQQVNHFQMLSSGTAQNLLCSSLNAPTYSINQSVTPIHLSMTPASNGSQSDKEQDQFPSK